MRVGVFGGSFDPPHKGHVALAHAARASLELDEVLVMPTHRNPFKRTGRTPSRQRLEMCKLTFLGEPGMAVSDLEVSRGGPSYTVDTLFELQAAQPAEYWLILGSDSVLGFMNWKGPERILRMARLGVAMRGSETWATLKGKMSPELAERIDLIQMPAVDVSSSDLRDRVARGQNVGLWVAPAVLDYIRDHQLYSL